MNRDRTRILACLLAIGSLTLAPAASALTLQLSLNITQADPGNPVGAVVGSFPNVGIGITSGGPLSGSGLEERPLRNGGSLTLTIGNEVFVETDDIEFNFAGDLPGAVFEDGVFTGLDYVVYFSMVSGDPVSQPFNTLCGDSSIGSCSDPAPLLATQHYLLDFDDENGTFEIAPIQSFPASPTFDDPDWVLEPNPSTPIVVGTLSATLVPEPSLLALWALGGLTLGRLRRR